MRNANNELEPDADADGITSSAGHIKNAYHMYFAKTKIAQQMSKKSFRRGWLSVQTQMRSF